MMVSYDLILVSSAVRKAMKSPVKKVPRTSSPYLNEAQLCFEKQTKTSLSRSIQSTLQGTTLPFW